MFRGGNAVIQAMAQKTLLAAMWEAGGDADAIRERLESGDLQLTGNFKGRELEIARDSRDEPQPGDWENEATDRSDS